MTQAHEVELTGAIPIDDNTALVESNYVAPGDINEDAFTATTGVQAFFDGTNEFAIIGNTECAAGHPMQFLALLRQVPPNRAHRARRVGVTSRRSQRVPTGRAARQPGDKSACERDAHRGQRVGEVAFRS